MSGEETLLAQQKLVLLPIEAGTTVEVEIPLWLYYHTLFYKEARTVPCTWHFTVRAKQGTVGPQPPKG
jgi:hypothetical protein